MRGEIKIAIPITKTVGRKLFSSHISDGKYLVVHDAITTKTTEIQINNTTNTEI